MKEISEEKINKMILRACNKVLDNLPLFTYQCQSHSSVNGIYPGCYNNQWTCGFWPGEIWLAKEFFESNGKKSEAEKCENSGQVLVKSFLNRIENHIEVDHHDMGFLYSPACVAAWKLTANEDAKKAALLAADQLITRFQEKGNFIQAWGKMGEADNYRYIIDCLMNTPLLYWATSVTGNQKYSDIANLHTQTCMKNSIRQDGSTYHTFFMDIKTGEPLRGATCQGYKDDSFWARGQAWSIYGTALAYRYTQKEEYKTTFNNVLNFYLSKLPKDLVPYWDMIFTDGSDEPRDSSSAAITACGLLEMANLIEKSDSKTASEYRTTAKKMLLSLTEFYSVPEDSRSNGLLMHGTYSKKSPYNTCTPEGVDECVSWGDYFYLEALMRLYNPNWKIYW